jgi:hypothetical protein
MSFASAWAALKEKMALFPHKVSGEVEAAMHDFHTEIVNELASLHARLLVLEGKAPKAIPNPAAPPAEEPPAV